MKLSRYIGKTIDLKYPNVDKVKLIQVTREYTNGNIFDNVPAFWFEYNNELYYGLVNYTMTPLETFDDWNKSFWELTPSDDLKKLLFNFIHPKKNTKHKNIYYKVDYKGILNSDETNLDEFSENELDLIKKYYRLYKINSI